MRQVMVRYTVRPGRAEENEKLVSAVFDELRRSAPSGIHYATFQLEDGVSSCTSPRLMAITIRSPIWGLLRISRGRSASAARLLRSSPSCARLDLFAFSTSREGAIPRQPLAHDRGCQ